MTKSNPPIVNPDLVALKASANSFPDGPDKVEMLTALAELEQADRQLQEIKARNALHDCALVNQTRIGMTLVAIPVCYLLYSIATGKIINFTADGYPYVYLRSDPLFFWTIVVTILIPTALISLPFAADYHNMKKVERGVRDLARIRTESTSPDDFLRRREEYGRQMFGDRATSIRLPTATREPVPAKQGSIAWWGAALWNSFKFMLSSAAVFVGLWFTVEAIQVHGIHAPAAPYPFLSEAM